MPIETLEASEHDAIPLLLLLFQVGATRYTYTTADTEITKDGLVYSPTEAIEPSKVESSAGEKGAALTLITDADFEIARLFLSNPPHTTMKLTVFLGHYGDNEYRVAWKGKVTGVNRIEGNKAEVYCEQNLSIVKRTGLTYRYGSGCQHSVYRGGCQLDFESNAIEGTITNIDGAKITATAFGSRPNGDLTGGVAVFNGSIYRMIIAHAANEITLSRPMPELSIGRILNAASGCDKTIARCKALGNTANYLGFNTVPERNPFNGLSNQSNNDSRGSSAASRLFNSFRD